MKIKKKQEILKLSKLTGTHKKIGQGIILKLFDSNKSLKLNENPNLGIIHDIDLLELINDLWKAKAEAISLNNQRIIFSTEIECVGPTILINKTRISSPFVIKAVGDPKKLIKFVKNGYVQTLELYGIKYFLEQYEYMEIPANTAITLTGDF
ncbi:MAG: DUF881 domain-containing protein [bacterium]